MHPDDPKRIKNVALFGHQGAGKTTLVETMLFEAGELQRRGHVEEGNTVSDYHPLEQERGNSLFSTLLHLNWKDHKLNLIDTPGFDDFAGEIHAALHVVDSVVMVLNAQYGVEVGTELIWENAQEAHKPTLFAINQLDTEKADYDRCLEQLQARFGSKILPVQYPLDQGPGFHRIIDALRMVMYVFGPEGGKPEKEAIPEAEAERAAALHNALVQAAAENDEGLMERYFERGTLDEEELQNGLRIAFRQTEIFPVFCVSARNNMGSGRIMGFIHDICPSAADMPPMPMANGSAVAPDPGADPLAFVFKTVAEAHLGEMSLFKVCTGTVRTGTDLVNGRKGNTERINQLYSINGKHREAVDHLVAGDIGATVKLKDTHTNDTLAVKGDARRVAPIHFPEPRIRGALVTANKGDEDKLANGLHHLHEEDPTYVVEHSQELSQTIVHGQGELHLAILLQRLKDRFKVDAHFEEPRIPYRETITRSAKAMYRHKKQTGGAGQFAEVHLLVEPWTEGMPPPAGMSVRDTQVIDMEWGGKLVFNWCIVGGAIDNKFATAIQKGIMEKMANGPLTGSYVRDVRVSVYDGKMHAVDSNDMAFKTAASMAFREAFREAGPQLMEPVYEVRVKTPSEMSGDVMSDLQTRRAQILGMDGDGHDQTIQAKVPLAELYQYSSTLRSLTQGRAKHTRRFAEYASVPHERQQELIHRHADTAEMA
jgi:elongation factor G